MSKKKEKSTRDIILEKALKSFNDRGIEYVGLRELAAALNIRVSNITYYFPTKDDLVNQLTLDLNRLNSHVMSEYQEISVQSFLETLERIFNNQLRYRCLMLSIVHIMEQNKVISARHKQTQRERNDVLKANLINLAKEGLLRLESDNDATYLASTISLISRFWISEAAISYKKQKASEQIKHNVSLIAHLLLPYSTKASKDIIKSFINN